ncbi:MAG: DNA polymerase IV [Lachnospiraceae bacterium]|jgi:DNA polymerase-4|nr:DNA polymerase IV [Lachnospiraceae bacterium]
MQSIIFHIDVNSAYLSWTALEQLKKGAYQDLRQIPAIIGGDMEKRHGVVLAKSIPAKKYGIQTGEPVVNAFRKCPSLVMAAPDHTLYAQRSREFMSYLLQICPDIEQVSVDECYMDYTPVSENYTSPEICADMIRQNILKQFGFTVNIGISDRKVLAKMASDFKKPNLTHTLYLAEIEKKMWPLPVSSLYMCGKSSQEALKKLEILTIGDLAHSDPEILQSHMKSHGRLLWEYANGIDRSTVLSEPAKAKGIGNSITLAQDALTPDQARPALLSLAESVASRLRAKGQRAMMETIEIKYADFQTVSHQTAFPSPVDSDQIIYETACKLFDETWNRSPVRLLGIRTAKLVQTSEPVQLTLFDLTQPERFEKQHKLNEAIDTIRKKYGEKAIVRGSLLSKNNEFQKH